MKGKAGKRLGQLGIQWHLMACLTAFVAVLMLLLWLFQVVLLDNFYQAIKTRTIKRTAQGIARNIDQQDLSQQLDSLTRQPDFYVRILDREGETVYNSRSGPMSMVHDMEKEEALRFFAAAEEKGGMVLELFRQDFPNPFAGPFREPEAGKDHREKRMWDKRHTTLVVCAQLVESQEQGTLLILLSSALSPLNTTAETLKVQFLCIAAILLLLSAGIAFLLSRHIGRPLAGLSRSARVLAEGRYDVTFEGGGYREALELSAALTYAAAELSKVEQLRRELIANVSHDLRTPLTLIAGYGEMMRDIPGENTPENVQIIIDEAQRLTGLVNDMLDLGKLQAGAQTLSAAPLSLTAMVREELLRYQRLVEREGYTILFAPGEEAIVDGDRSKLSQVVYNLIGNAVNHTGADKKVLVEQEVREGWVTLSVLDSGPGIPPEELPYVWDRYYKVDKTHKRAAIGTGLGLSIVRGVVELHHGRCGVESTPGQGSRFWFSLPCREEAVL